MNQKIVLHPYLLSTPIYLTVPESISIYSILEALYSLCPELPPSISELYLNNEILSKSMTLKEVHFSESDVFVQKKINLINNQSLPKSMMTKQPDIFGFECENENYFATMPCGHVVSPDGLLDYLRIFLVSQKDLQIKCPAVVGNSLCHAAWDYKLCKEICQLSKSEKQDLEIKFANNFLSLQMRVKSCPKCSIFISKKKITQKKIICPNCQYTFCWICLKAWQKIEDKDNCGELNCGNDLELFKYFVFCKRKKIGYVDGVPQIRCCPKCFELIEHITACKHVTCKRCNNNFCFVCLKSQIKGYWQCGTHADACPVAAPQEIKKYLNM